MKNLIFKNLISLVFIIFLSTYALNITQLDKLEKDAASGDQAAQNQLAELNRHTMKFSDEGGFEIQRIEPSKNRRNLMWQFQTNPVNYNVMGKGKNIISKQLDYAEDAVKKMKEHRVSQQKVEQVLHTGRREWASEDSGFERFVERKNKINPLTVVVDRNKDPNVVVTVIKGNPVVKHPVRTLTAGRLREELKKKKLKKRKIFNAKRETLASKIEQFQARL
jgi:hypothetical protein